MRQDNNLANNQVNALVSVQDNVAAGSVIEPAAGGNMMADGGEKKKGGNGMLYGMILCAVLAIGGIGFGVWAMMDGNTKAEQLSAQNTVLKEQNNGYMKRISQLEAENTKSVNSDQQVSDTGVQDSQEQVATNEKSENVAAGAATEGGYEIISIGRCVFDAGPVPGEGFIF